MNNSGYKKNNHEILLQNPIPKQTRFIHNIDTSINSMVDIGNYTPTYSGDMPNFNSMDMMQLKEFQQANSEALLSQKQILDAYQNNSTQQKQQTVEVENTNETDTSN